MEGDPLGAPSHYSRALLGVWLYGFMTGIRSGWKLKVAGRSVRMTPRLMGRQ